MIYKSDDEEEYILFGFGERERSVKVLSLTVWK